MMLRAAEDLGVPLLSINGSPSDQSALPEHLADVISITAVAAKKP